MRASLAKLNPPASGGFFNLASSGFIGGSDVASHNESNDYGRQYRMQN